MKKNLVYFCILFQKSYADLLELLLLSMREYGCLNPETTDILLITESGFKDDILAQVARSGFSIKVWALNIPCSILTAAASRMYIFEWPEVSQYDKFLYMDVDILVTGNINTLLDIPIERTKIYAVEDLTLSSEYHGSQFHPSPPTVDMSAPAFSSGILMFHNSSEIKDLFRATNEFIYDYMHVKMNSIPGCLDQPFLVYMAAVRNMMYDVSTISRFVILGRSPENVVDGIVLYHFCGYLGYPSPKKVEMVKFIVTLLNYKSGQNGTAGLRISDYE